MLKLIFSECSPLGRTPERENDDTYSSSSGFSDENRWIHRSTQTELPQLIDDDTGSSTQVHYDESSDYKSLFREIFKIIHQNL